MRPMVILRITTLPVLLASMAGGLADAQAPSSGFPGPIVAKYCGNCHGATKPKGGLDLASARDEAGVIKNLKGWQKALENVEGGTMPPDEAPQMAEAEAATLVAYLQGVVSKASCKANPDPGRVTLRRLNREEYNNTVRDLVGVDLRPADDFPSDDVGYGFDNIGDVLTLPPLLMEKYLAAAEAVAEAAILADETPRGTSRKIRPGTLPDAAKHGHPDDQGGS